jgi:hypothetical protein
MSIFETQKGFNRQALPYFTLMVDLGILTDAILAPLTTVAGLRAVAFTGYETQRRFYEQWQKKVDRLEAIGVLTDTTVAASNDTATLLALMTANDASLSVGGNMSYAA